MPPARIHEAIIKEINKDKKMDELLLRIGTVAPDSWRNVDEKSGYKDKYLTHFWDFRVKDGYAYNYKEFFIKYYDKLSDPFYLGYLVHLIVDQYWKTNIDPKYFITENGEKKYKLKNGDIIVDKEHWGYYDSLKMLRMLAKAYDLEDFPIRKDDIINLHSEIDELDVDGLFGENGTLNYINTSTSKNDANEESLVYDIDTVLEEIKETTNFVKQELINLEEYKKELDKKVKIAVDIDDTLLCTKELEDFYWEDFLKNNPNIDSNKNYVWGDPELSLFWSLYRENMAFGKVKDGASDSLIELMNNGYQVDILSARPLNKYASLKKRLVEYFEDNHLEYKNMNLGFHSKKEFLKEHNYDILIDNDVNCVLDAISCGITPILFGNSSDDIIEYQTEDWSSIPSLIKKIINKKVR